MAASARELAVPASVRQSEINKAVLRVAFLANVGLIAAMWAWHGGAGTATTSLPSFLVGMGQITALMGTYLALVGLLLVARMPAVERLLGDESLRIHRLAGIGTVVLLIAHVAFSVSGYAAFGAASLVDEFTSMVLTYPYMLAGLVAFLFILAIGSTSIRSSRVRLSFETWSGIHLYAYLAMVLGFGHQLVVGSDFAMHPIARLYWIGLYVAVFEIIVIYRILVPFAMLARHQFRVQRVVEEAPGVVSIYIHGRNLDRLQARAGQYFRVRLLIRNEWWRSHPFSISAAPGGRSIRFTVKALGDFSTRIQNLKPGARVLLEGPSGALTSELRTSWRVLLIGGGIGITPLRALFEELTGYADVRLLYRASRLEDVVFADELGILSGARGSDVTYLVGRRSGRVAGGDPLGAASLLSLVPDIRARDVFLCGPAPMMTTVAQSLRELGVPSSRIHSERFA